MDFFSNKGGDANEYKHYTKQRILFKLNVLRNKINYFFDKKHDKKK